MYGSVCKFGWGRKGSEKRLSHLAEKRGTGRGYGKGLDHFWIGKKVEGVLTPELCDQHEPKDGTPMLLDQATTRNVSRALRQINGFKREPLNRSRARR
jgi:hypothetical protein